MLCQVLAGMGGVGKTQLAADHARTAWERGELDLLVWISAGTRAAIVAGYAQAAVEVLAADPGDPEHAARAFLAWLEPKPDEKPCRWLVVLDDLADPADLRGLWPPSSAHGRTLATTRRRDAALTAAGRHLVPVGLFTPSEAAVYLTEVLAAHRRREPPDQVRRLATDLGHLPLALAQAAAYLVDAGLDCAAYRTLLADQISTLADLVPEPGALPDDQAVTIAATWSLSVERADRLRPRGLARPMLQLAAMLDPNGIPHPVLTSAPALEHLTASRTSAGEPGPAPVEVQDAVGALRILHRLHLIDHAPRTPHRAVRIHQLVRRATRDTLTLAQRDHFARTAAEALTAAWPEIERDTALAQALRANADALTSHAEDVLYQPDIHAVLNRTGRSLGESGQVAAARDHYQHLTNQASRRLGPDHPDTLTASHDLACWRGEAGDAAGAAAAFAELLPDTLRVLGPDHPDTLNARAHLAGWRGEAGDVSGAATAYADLVPHMVRVLGRDHPRVASGLANTAYWRGRAGDAAGAVAAYAELLPDMLRVLGPDHLDTLRTRYNLAYWREEAGDVSGAVAAYAELLPDMLRVLGPGHPETLTTRGSLASSMGRSGDVSGTVAAYGELLANVLRVLGPDHPYTLTVRGGLARWRGEAGDTDGAAIAYAELLPDTLRVMGRDHPDTLAVRCDFAYWRGEAGAVDESMTAFAELLPDMLRVLGPDHPHTLITRHNLAYWREEAGDVSGAATAYAELLPVMLRVLGPDHPETLIVRGELARLRGKTGDAAGAVTAFAQLLADRERVVGPDHPDTLSTRHDLTHWQNRAAGHDQAAG
ncbi:MULTISPECIES: tetratricopeptide repeat protein [unclassified Streptomyces]|uniref:tetratricopeptide repeat protein n=1 Tax=unclassified Streptomyces TaxID=2593676 RepID=UPI002E1D8CAA